MSIIREAFGGDETDSPLQIHLLYGSRVPDDVIFDAELTALADAHPGLHYSPIISEPPPGYGGRCGFLDARTIREQAGDLAGKTVYICGPNVMYDFCLEALIKLGVPEYKIKRELYGPPDDVTNEPGWPPGLDAGTIFEVEVDGRAAIRAAAGEPLLNSLERYGIVVPVICRAGECSACRTRLLSGRVFQPAGTDLRESDREHGYIHACVSYPLENLRIRV
jgi:ferredoxin